MQAYPRSVAAAVPSVRVSTVVLSLTGGFVGVMAYTGSVAPFLWVVAVLLGVGFHRRLPRSEAGWRSVVTAGSLLVAGGALGVTAYSGAFGAAPVFAGASLAALALAPDASV
jgi:hypothetical protein